MSVRSLNYWLYHGLSFKQAVRRERKVQWVLRLVWFLVGLVLGKVL
jgi:hypothetical protein